MSVNVNCDINTCMLFLLGIKNYSCTILCLFLDVYFCWTVMYMYLQLNNAFPDTGIHIIHTYFILSLY